MCIFLSFEYNLRRAAQIIESSSRGIWSVGLCFRGAGVFKKVNGRRSRRSEESGDLTSMPNCMRGWKRKQTPFMRATGEIVSSEDSLVHLQKRKENLESSLGYGQFSK